MAPPYEALLEFIRTVPVVDAHSHLMPEAEHVAQPRDVLRVFGQYVRVPMFASGLPLEDWPRIHDPALPLMDRWRLMKPYLPLVRHTSFFRAAQKTLRHFWGAGELNDGNVEELSVRVAADNRPGIYDRVLRLESGIVRVLDQDSGHDGHDDAADLEAFRNQEILAPVVSVIDVTLDGTGTTAHRIHEAASLEAYMQGARHRIHAMAAAGAVGYKMHAIAEVAPDRRAAGEEFAEMRRRSRPLKLDHPGALRSHIQDELLSEVEQTGLPVAVHTGFWQVDRYRPLHIVPVLERHPGIHFDLFHTGMPYVRESGTIAVNYPNTSVNLCWAHSVNASMTAHALDEYIDQLGLDKIIAFGDDVRWMVEKVWGHLEVARENVARVLAGRVSRGDMDLDGAREMARAWFFENPARIYRVPKGCD
jgi:predicted TIM-barrel fold metal-dependent hydrolase